VKKQVCELFGEELGKRISLEEEENVSFLGEGGTSLMLMKLSGRIQEVFGLRIEMGRLLSDSSVKRIVKLIGREESQTSEEQQQQTRKTREIVEEQQRRTLYCRTTEDCILYG